MPRLAIITYLDGAGDNGPVDPGYGHPTPPPRPNHSLPPGAISLPVFPFDPTIDNSLPTTPGLPSNALPGAGLPSTQPIVPGKKFVVKWLACHGLILVPDNSLPGTPPPVGSPV